MPAFLPAEYYGWGPAGLQSMWLQNSYTTEVTEYICCLQETYFRLRETYRLKVMVWKKVFQANENQKKDGLAILIPEKTDIKIKMITRDKEGHYIMIEELIQK